MASLSPETECNYNGLELMFHAFKSSLLRDSDAIILFVHWYLTRNGFVCIVDGQRTEILPTNWNENPNECVLNYALNSNGYELKILKDDQSLIVNLLKKSNDKSSTFTCHVKNYVSNIKNPFNDLYKNLQDLHDLMNKEFLSIYKDDADPKETQSISTQRTEPSSQTRQHNERLTEPDRLPRYDPLRVDRGRQPPEHPFSIGRGDLDPFHFDPSGSSGMIFDPFRDMQRRDIPPNIPRGSIPPEARFDPYAPPNPDDLNPLRSSRSGPNPDHLRPPGGLGNDDMFM